MNGTTPLAEVKKHIEDNAKDGVRCPACGRYCKVYQYHLHSSMVECLIGLVRAYKRKLEKYSKLPEMPPGGVWVHVRSVSVRGGNATNRGGHLAKGQHWGLVEPKPNDEDPTKRSSGYWRPTQLAMDFVNDLTELPKYVLLYQNEVQGLAPKTIGIKEALGKRINYEELMASAKP